MKTTKDNGTLNSRQLVSPVSMFKLKSSSSCGKPKHIAEQMQPKQFSSTNILTHSH